LNVELNRFENELLNINNAPQTDEIVFCLREKTQKPPERYLYLNEGLKLAL
jgi:hypothetical protein